MTNIIGSNPFRKHDDEYQNTICAVKELIKDILIKCFSANLECECEKNYCC